MPNVINTLYAPLISTWMRAFPNTEDAIIYFSYSPLNDNEMVQKVHLSLVNQLNNENALEDPTGVLIYSTGDTTGGATSGVGFDTKSGLYYVVIPHNALKGGLDWAINQYYKVQLRLDATEGGEFTDTRTKMAYLTENQEQFSEWSTVCLIRPILRPQIYLKPWALHPEASSYEAKFNKGIVNLSGFVQFGSSDSLETETMENYVIDIVTKDAQDIVVWTSGTVYTGNLIDPNDINYQLTLQGIDTSLTRQFVMKVTVTTKNQYVFTEELDFSINDFVEMTDFHPIGVHTDDPDNHDLFVELDEEEGIASFRFQNEVALYGNIYVKRSSNLSHFTDWETIYEEHVSDAVDITIVDNTIGALVWYRYSIQFENSRGALSRVYYTDQFLAKFYNAFIMRLDTQLDVRYDFKISNMKPVVNRTKIDTLGGRYPKFAENAILNYKQFSISGIISAEADYNQLFMNKQSFYGEEWANYKVYLAQEGIESVVRNDSKHYADKDGYITTTRSDYFWEREFREKAIEWLNDGEPKLFRSVTEGNIPVMITDVSLTPKAQMNRLLYDFTATMYEIGKGESLADLEALGIYHVPRIAEKIGDGDPSDAPGMGADDSRVVKIIGQVYNISPTNNNNIITSGDIYKSIIDRYNMSGIYQDREAYNLYIENVKIFFHNKPNLFYIGANNSLQHVPNPNSVQANSGRMRLGYSFQLQTSESAGWETIFVNERGYYQIPNDLDITGLAFNQYTDDKTGVVGDTVTIEYIAVFNERSALGTLIASSSVERNVIGQYEGVFRPRQMLGDLIRSKYSYTTLLYTQFMSSWKGICLDVTPYAVVNIRYRDDNDFRQYTVGATGVFHLLKDFPIEDLYFQGISMVEQPIERQGYVQPWEYVRSNQSGLTTQDIKKPINNTVYKIADQDMIYYNDSWVQFTDEKDGTGIAAIRVQGQINFVGDVIRNEY